MSNSLHNVVECAQAISSSFPPSPSVCLVIGGQSSIFFMFDSLSPLSQFISFSYLVFLFCVALCLTRACDNRWWWW